LLPGVLARTEFCIFVGGATSPLLANVYLHDFDRIWTATCSHLGKLVRYADDFVILCRTWAQAEQALARVQEIMGLLRSQLHPTKTRLAELELGKHGFTFLSCYLRIVRSHFKGKCYLFRWPSPKAMQAIRTRIRDLTRRRRWAKLSDIREVIRALNPVLRGWAAISARATPRASSMRLMPTCMSGFYVCSSDAAVNGVGGLAVVRSLRGTGRIAV
jgi:reverse transcriptase-like protein/group II intron maturase